MSLPRLSQTYARQILKKGHDHPLWIPEPSQSLTSAYIERGFSIGDVGIFTDEGSFEYLFNVSLPADHPINLGRVPPYSY